MKKVFTDPPALQNFVAWGLDVPYKMGVHCGDFAFLTGQTAFDPADSHGAVLFPGDLAKQTRLVMERNAILLSDIGAGFDDVVHMTSYYVGVAGWQQSVAIQAEFLPNEHVASTAVGIHHPANFDLTARVEIEMIAMPGLNRKVANASKRGRTAPDPFADGVRVGEFAFVSAQQAVDPNGRIRHPGDKIGQAEVALKRLCAVLEELGSSSQDVVKLRAFHVSADHWDDVLKLEGQYFGGPLVRSTVAVPELTHPGALIQFDAIAFLGERIGRSSKQRTRNPLESQGFDAGVKCGNMILIGAQLALDDQGSIIAPSDTMRQVDVVMTNFKSILDSFGANIDDVVKTNTFYAGGEDEDWPGLIVARGKHFNKGPAVTGVRVSRLYDPQATIQVEGVALLE